MIGCICGIGYSEGPLNTCYKYFGTLIRVIILFASLAFAIYLLVKTWGEKQDCIELYVIVLISAILVLILFIWFFLVHMECEGGWHWGECWFFAFADDGYYEDRMETFKKVFIVFYNLSHWAILIFALTMFINASKKGEKLVDFPKDYLCPTFWRETTLYVLLNLFELICSIAVEFVHFLVNCGAYCGLKRRSRRPPIEKKQRQPVEYQQREGPVGSQLSEKLLGNETGVV